MLRTNLAFLDYIEGLYQLQLRKEDVLLKEFSAEQLLLQQGEQAAKVLVIKEGICKCFINGGNDKDFIVEFLGEGEIVGEIEAIKDTLCLCNIKALTPVRAYAIAIPYFKSLLTSNLPFNNLLLDTFVKRIVNTSSRAAFQQSHTLEHTLSKLLELLQQQGLLISKEDMAAYLGITLRSLNRALKKLNVAL